MLQEIRFEDNLVSVLSFKWKREINWNKFKDMIDSKDVALCFYIRMMWNEARIYVVRQFFHQSCMIEYQDLVLSNGYCWCYKPKTFILFQVKIFVVYKEMCKINVVFLCKIFGLLFFSVVFCVCTCTITCQTDHNCLMKNT